MAIYLIANGPSPTTDSQVGVDVGSTIKTLLQVKASDTLAMRIIEWGISFKGFAAAEPPVIELLETDVAATVTAHVTAGIVKYDALALAGGNPVTNLIRVGVAETGYTSSNEQTITASRMLDPQFIAPSNQYVKQFPLGREPIVQVGKFLRIRSKSIAAVDAICYVLVEV